MIKFILLFLISFSSRAELSLISPGESISALKFNEIITKINSLENDLPPIGSIISIPGICPADYMLADGSSLNRISYSKLYAVIGSAHGTSDSNSFNIPDYRGLFLRGADQGSLLDPNYSSRSPMKPGGNSSGVGSVQLSEIKEHAHDMQRRGNPNASTYDAGDGRWNENSGMTTDRSILNSFSIGNSGGQESRPKNIYVNYCIKYN